MASADPYFPFGEPPHDDVDAAARLLLKYQDAGKTGQEFGSMFARIVKDIDAVLERAKQLRGRRKRTGAR